MENDSILEIEKTWSNKKKLYKEKAYMFITVPVICSSSPVDGEHITNELSRYLFEKKILEKVCPQHEDYLVFTAAYTPPHARGFALIQELYHLFREAAGYYGSYRGILMADVSEWRGHYREKYFDSFLSYLADQRSNGILPFFFAGCDSSEQDMLTLSAMTSSYFKTIRIRFGTNDLYTYALSLLKDKGIYLDESGCHYLNGFVDRAVHSELFHGTESIRHICDSMARSCKTENMCTPLNDTAVKAIVTELGYADIYAGKTIHAIGFR